MSLFPAHSSPLLLQDPFDKAQISVCTSAVSIPSHFLREFIVKEQQRRSNDQTETEDRVMTVFVLVMLLGVLPCCVALVWLWRSQGVSAECKLEKIAIRDADPFAKKARSARNRRTQQPASSQLPPHPQDHKVTDEESGGEGNGADARSHISGFVPAASTGEVSALGRALDHMLVEPVEAPAVEAPAILTAASERESL